MPLLDTSTSPEAKVLATQIFRPKNKRELREVLDSNFLGVEDIIGELGRVATTSESDALRLKAIDTALKLHPETRQAMKDADAASVPVVNIIISDAIGVNPILIPRKVA